MSLIFDLMVMTWH